MANQSNEHLNMEGYIKHLNNQITKWKWEVRNEIYDSQQRKNKIKKLLIKKKTN